MKLIRCDECQKEIPEGRPHYTVDYPMLIVGDWWGEAHFCCDACIGNFFLKRAVDKEKQRLKWKEDESH